MGKEDLIVDNPLLLTSLFNKGIFKNTEVKFSNDKPVSEDLNPKEQSTLAPPEASTKSSQEIPTAEQIQVPAVSVLHIVFETGQSPYKTETIPNAMSALGKLANKPVPSFEIMDLKQLPCELAAYIALVPTNTRVILWAAELPEIGTINIDNKRMLLLSMPSVMLSSQERKTDHWNKMKAFFKIA